LGCWLGLAPDLAREQAGRGSAVKSSPIASRRGVGCMFAKAEFVKQRFRAKDFSNCDFALDFGDDSTV
ncbi:Protein FAM216A, partial [Frankliniella fusca]